MAGIAYFSRLDILGAGGSSSFLQPSSRFASQNCPSTSVISTLSETVSTLRLPDGANDLEQRSLYWAIHFHGEAQLLLS